jgi:hypothetical protein
VFEEEDCLMEHAARKKKGSKETAGYNNSTKLSATHYISKPDLSQPFQIEASQSSQSLDAAHYLTSNYKA